MNKRGTVIVACAVVAMLSGILVAGQSLPIVAYVALTDGLLAILWLLSAVGWGWFIVARVPSIKTRLLRFVVSAALGIGAIGLIVLALGLAGAMTSVVASGIGTVGVGMLVFAMRATVKSLSREAANAWLRERVSVAWWWVVAMPMVGVVVVACVAPPGVLWGDEPNGYDVVEYHLQVPREWFEAGRITALSHNVYSHLPMGVELHYLLAMHLRGGPWAGMYLAQFMHATMVAMSVVAVCAVTREVLGSAASGVVAGLAMCAAPWLMLLAPVAYNEGGLLLFGTIAVGLVWLALSRERQAEMRTWALAGAMAGFACGVKLTAAPMLLAAVPVAALSSQFRGMSMGLLKRLVIFIVTGTIVFAPWLVRNVAWTGNPVFPEAMKTLGRGHFNETQVERWGRAHSPAELSNPIAGRFAAAGNQILFDWRFGYVLLPLAVAGIALRRKPDAWFLAGLIVVMFITWIGFTHLQSRFFVLAIPVAAFAIASLDVLPRTAVAVVLSLASAAGLVRWAVMYETAADGSPRLLSTAVSAGAMGIERLDIFAGVDLTAIPEDRVVALVGDARAFLYSRPMTRLRYRTVFDVNAAPDGSVIDSWLGGDVPGDAVIVVDPNELRRFNKTYWKVPPPPPEVASQAAPFVLRR